jgi:hypothetical protein
MLKITRGFMKMFSRGIDPLQDPPCQPLSHKKKGPDSNQNPRLHPSPALASPQSLRAAAAATATPCGHHATNLSRSRGGLQLYVGEDGAGNLHGWHRGAGAGAWGGPLRRRSRLHHPPRRRGLRHHQVAALATLSCTQIRLKY